MKKEVHGCACCSPEFGKIFKQNKTVEELNAMHPSGVGVARACIGHVGNLARRDFLKGSVVAGAASLLPVSIGLAHAEQNAATVFTGGIVLTVDKNFSQAEAIAIQGNKILAVGTDAEVRAIAGENAKIVDIEGKTVLPGFIDPHTHVVAGSVVDSVMEYVGMARFRTVDEVLEHLGKIARSKAPGEWIVVRNFDPSIQEGPDELTFNELDAVSMQHPIFVFNASGHLAYANSKAFEVSGIPADVQNPPGAEFVRDENGKLNGVMKNNVAFLQILTNYPALAEANPTETLIGLLDSWSQHGLTTVSELALGGLSQSPADFAVMSDAAQSGRLKARIRAYPFYAIGEKSWDEAGVKPGSGNELARIAGYKLVADGSNQGFTGLQREPYLNSDDRGLAYMTAEDLRERAIERASKGWHLAIHGNGDAGIDNILDACEAMRDAGIDMDKVRVRIEHCSILHDDQIARMKDLGVSASFLIGHVHYWGVAMRDDVFGEEKAQLLDRCASAQKAGVGFSLHSDFMVTDPVPLHMIEMAVTRKTWKDPDYVLAPNEVVSVETAIRAMTSEAAWQLFSDHEIGSLETGKLADFVILDKDPRSVDPDAIKEINVLQTWMDGKKVYQA
ncbi:amidohydrolase family protein [Thalassospira tepidiphila]|uniref:amidohydrolase family protein n=1 Tax=Thalassospira tepidiphila TaxID=393657 RepID=UPI003AA8927F